jgi:lipopolysaccharide export system protein LptC
VTNQMARYVNDPKTGRLVPSEAAAGAPAQRSRMDNWAFRDRPSAEATVGYSRFVRIMKVMLPLVAFSLIVLVVVYSTMRRDNATIQITATDLKGLTNDKQLVKPKLTGTDGRGQPFTVTADAATAAPGKARNLIFQSVTADVTMQDKSWFQVDAKKGLLDGEAKTLDLTETINIYSDKGYECHTASARYDFGLGLLKGDFPIRCQGPLGIITGKKFEGLRDPGIMRFTGGVTTTYFPAAREGLAAQAAETNPEGIAEALPDEGGGVTVLDEQETVPPLPGPIIQPKTKPVVP